MANFDKYKIANLVIDQDGSLTESGAFDLVLTVTANTNVTLPTSGTLATTANITTHANLITGVHGLVITTAKTFTLTNSLTLSGTDGSTLNIGTGGTLGTAAYLTAGTSANNAVQLNASAELPAVSGANLTNLPSGGLLIAEDSGYGLDNSSVGRGTVGTKAVSLEYSPSGSTYGASGVYSHAGGYITTASGDYSHAVGYNTTASGDYSHAGGYITTASGNYSHAVGSATTASGFNSHAGGYNTTASGQYSHTVGIYTLAPHYAEHSHSSGRFTVDGDCQNGKVQARIATSSTSEAELFLDGVDDQFTLEDNDAYTCRVTVFGAQADGSIGEAVYQVKIKRQALLTELSQTVQTILAWDGDTNLGTPTWALTADDTNEALAIKVTPANTTATRWTAVIEYVKINY